MAVRLLKRVFTRAGMIWWEDANSAGPLLTALKVERFCSEARLPYFSRIQIKCSKIASLIACCCAEYRCISCVCIRISESNSIYASTWRPNSSFRESKQPMHVPVISESISLNAVMQYSPSFFTKRKSKGRCITLVSLRCVSNALRHELTHSMNNREEQIGVRER